MIDEATRLMQEMALRFFNNRCEVTLEKFRPRGFVIHHVKELDYGEVLRSQYLGGEKQRAVYLSDLLPLVEEDYNSSIYNGSERRYALIRNPIHTKLDHLRNGITRLEMEKRKRFCDLALRTIHKKKSKVNKKQHFKRY